MVFRQTKDRAILDYGAVFLAKAAVQSLPDCAFARIARHHPIDQVGRVFALNIVFVEWRDIDQSGGISNCVVLVVMKDIIGAGDEIPRPGAPVLADAQLRGARMKGSSNWHWLFWILDRRIICTSR